MMQHSPNYRELLLLLADFFSGDVALFIPYHATLFYPEVFSLSETDVLSHVFSSGITVYHRPTEPLTLLPPSMIQLGEFGSSLLEHLDTLQKQWIFEHQHDGLTRLPNRHYFGDALLWAWERFNEQHGPPYGLILLNIDRFKRINDSMGHLAGDCLLFEVSARLSDLYQHTETLVAHVGGDEFAFLLTHDRLKQEVQTLQRAFKDPFDVFGQNIFLSISSGSSLANPNHTDEDMIHQEAERALKLSKQRGRDQHVYFDPNHMGAQPDRLMLEEDLRIALQYNEQICIYAQYMVEARDEKIYACEILARWHHPQRGLLSPAIFMPIVEENHLELLFDRCIIQQVFRAIQGHEWTRWLAIHINLSPKHIHDMEFLLWLDELLLMHEEVHPSQIYFEITEGTLIDHPEKAHRMMEGLRQRGFRLVLDDFGTGYSSLAYLSRYVFDELKIDRSFIQSMHHDQKQLNIVSGLIALSHALDMHVVAEGVEHPSQAEQLRHLGCDFMQGYLFSKPKPWVVHQDSLSTHKILE
jgi:diguanylate cyclase (GGDEF)-like protein